jgi:cytochrome c peroxidase
MKKSILLLTMFTIAGLIIIQSCQKTDLPYQTDNLQLPDEVFDYEGVEIPSFYNSNFGWGFTPSPNITNHGATLGRVLFYDKKLSLNNRIACASCHHQDKSFSDGKVLSDGFNDRKTRRNAPALINTFTQGAFFWDARTAQLEDLVLQPIQDHIEMGLENMDDLEIKLAAVDYYPQLFQNAFGNTLITKDQIQEALRQYVDAMISLDNRFDKSFWSGTLLTSNEQKGFELFHEHCVSCHGGDDFRGWDQLEFANIGLDMDYTDKGKYEVSNIGIDKGVFKVPSLRNIALSAPYMHDGRFETLREVIEHYSLNVQPHPNLDDRLKDENDNPKRLNLLDSEINQLISFLNTLTDEQFINAEQFSDPFQ